MIETRLLRPQLVAFLTIARQGHETGSLAPERVAVARHYGLQDVKELEHLWRAWLAEGRQRLALREELSVGDVARVLRGGAGTSARFVEPTSTGE